MLKEPLGINGLNKTVIVCSGSMSEAIVSLATSPELFRQPAFNLKPGYLWKIFPLQNESD